MDKKLHPLGRIAKRHGYNGAVVLVSDQPFDENVEYLKEVFIRIDGLLVPFPVEEFDLMTGTSAFVQLGFVNNEKDTLQLMDCGMYAETISVKTEPEAEWKQWTGFAVHDTEYGNIGVIQNIENYNGNIVWQVTDGEKETLISLCPGLVSAIDHHAKTVHITAPNGYF